MRIWTYETGKSAKDALNYYKNLGLTKRDICACSEKCEAHKDFMVVLDFDAYGKEQGLMILKEREISNPTKKKFAVGSFVEHKIFGKGQVLSVGETTSKIRFNRDGAEREILFQFLKGAKI